MVRNFAIGAGWGYYIHIHTNATLALAGRSISGFFRTDRGTEEQVGGRGLGLLPKSSSLIFFLFSSSRFELGTKAVSRFQFSCYNSFDYSSFLLHSAVDTIQYCAGTMHLGEPKWGEYSIRLESPISSISYIQNLDYGNLIGVVDR